MRAVVIGFGLLIVLLLLLFRVAEFQVWQGNLRLEVVVAVAAVLFFFIGVYVNRSNVRVAKDAERTGEATLRPPLTTADAGEARASGLTARELEVLQKMAEGGSNAEIAQALFLSETTVKSHVSNILFKLGARRRTEAVQLARSRRILS